MCLVEPVPRIGLVTLHKMNDAVGPARKRRLVILLHNLVRALPVARLEISDCFVELTVANFHTQPLTRSVIAFLRANGQYLRLHGGASPF